MAGYSNRITGIVSYAIRATGIWELEKRNAKLKGEMQDEETLFNFISSFH
jgi:hypothetical protein